MNRYYPFPFKNNTKLTFQSLANHSSGLPRLPSNLVFLDPDNPYKHYNKSYLDKYLKDLIEIKSDSKNNYTYSNLGFAILGYTLGLSQNKEFEQLLQERVLDKYGMKQSYTRICHISNNLVAGLNANGDTTPNWQFNIFFGAGGVLSTTEDLSKFAKAQFDSQHSELALTQKPTFTVNETLKLGLGWHILKTQNGKELLTHNGGTGGYSSSMLVNVAEQTAVIILSNVSAFHQKVSNIEELSFDLYSFLPLNLK
ncbi:MAG: serine hydrolase [Fermentimonas sp.]|nr:serine hydrolase [Fermentimonas sp.]